MTWRTGMARAYERGLADGGTRASNGARGVARPELGEGFDACYWQGFGHGSGRCICPEKLAGKRWGQCCVVCGVRRHP